MFENEETKDERSIWENVIILARKGVNNRDDEGFQVFKISSRKKLFFSNTQGALAAVPKNFKNKVNCIGYNLDTSQHGAISEEKAKAILEKAIRGISEQVSGESVNEAIKINTLNTINRILRIQQSPEIWLNPKKSFFYKCECLPKILRR